jgi:hypothetical protein
MSAPPRPSSPSLSPTRQQLDDLEALMQRMLALPVNHLPEEPAADVKTGDVPDGSEPPRIESDLDRILAEFPAKSWPSREEPAEKPQSERTPTVLEVDIPAPPPEPVLPTEPELDVEPRALSRPEDTTLLQCDELQESPAEETKPFSPTEYVAAPTPAPDPSAEATPAPWSEPPPVRREVAPRQPRPEPPPASADEPPVPLLLRPLVQVNDAFDLCTVCLGPLGRWLRGRGGRALLGVVGLLLLAAAVAWGVLDWMGVTW